MDEIRITPQGGAQVNDADRLALATLLVKMGYTVRIGKVKSADGKRNVIFVGARAGGKEG